MKKNKCCIDILKRQLFKKIILKRLLLWDGSSTFYLYIFIR